MKTIIQQLKDQKVLLTNNTTRTNNAMIAMNVQIRELKEMMHILTSLVAQIRDSPQGTTDNGPSISQMFNFPLQSEDEVILLENRLETEESTSLKLVII